MADQAMYKEKAKNILRAELKRKGMSYKQLAKSLENFGVVENDRNLANKISRGAFSAAFFCFP